LPRTISCRLFGALRGAKAAFRCRRSDQSAASLRSVFFVSSNVPLIAHRSEHEAVVWLSLYFFQSCAGEGRFKVRPGHRYGSVASERVFGSPMVLPSRLKFFLNWYLGLRVAERRGDVRAAAAR
jgi:hypothetical protein